ncbi:hypothetical protein DVH24_001088 [Malus domestica]|uniref:Acyl-[acyl-carrier-protein] desaturase n=1 Tax=Malus domestica TaxID=3750 RepID=A0A498K3G8_MALDO|nr:hypothetical protein DVH24_001088 [Malus domestica]
MMMTSCLTPPKCAMASSSASTTLGPAASKERELRIDEINNRNGNYVHNYKKAFMPRRELRYQEITHSMPSQKIEIFKYLEDWAEHNILVHLKPVDKCWQPQDFLPHSRTTGDTDGFLEQVKELRERANEIPDDYFVVLVGNMITEDALPTYQTMLNTLDGVQDETGSSPISWAVWNRAWTAEENRHGDLLNKATAISHGNTAKLAKEHGDLKLAQICGTIASDEKRREAAYTKIVAKLFEFVAQRLGVYTTNDYADILELLLSVWKVETLTGLSPEGRKAQDYVCGLAPRIRKLEERVQLRDKRPLTSVPISWIFGGQVRVI